jgi:hypothetical protein
MKKDALESKIRKLMALSESSNVHEAAAASAAAQLLIDKYKIEIIISNIKENSSDLLEDTIGSRPEYALFRYRKRKPAWKWAVAWAVTSANDCKPWLARDGDALCVFPVGKESDCSHCAVLFKYIIENIEMLAESTFVPRRTLMPGNSNRGEKRKWKHAYILGAASAVKERLADSARKKSEEAARAASERGLSASDAERAIQRIESRGDAVEKWMNKRNMRYSEKKVRASHTSDRAYSQGYRAGQSMSIGSERKALKDA